MELSEWREELAGVLESVVCDLNNRGVISDGYGWNEIAEGTLAAPALARLFAEVRAEAWDEGYETCTNDTEARSAPPGPNGPVDPQSNPYRTTAHPTDFTLTCEDVGCVDGRTIQGRKYHYDGSVEDQWADCGRRADNCPAHPTDDHAGEAK